MRHSTLPNERSFGILFTFILLVCAGFSYYKAVSMMLTMLLVAAAILLLSLLLISPDLLRPLNKVWFEFGVLLGKVVSPIVLGAMFYLIITPIAVITRIFGRDELNLKRRVLDTYWINRDPVGPQPESFKNQF